jgi:hypothetical protein
LVVDGLPTSVIVLCGSVLLASLLLYVGIFAVQFRLLRDIPTQFAPLARADRERKLRGLRTGVLAMVVVFLLLTSLVDGYAALALLELLPHATSLIYVGGVAVVTLVYWTWVALTVALTYYIGHERVLRRGLRD